MFDYESRHSAISELHKKQLFFVGGTMKSGTTWLQLLLDSHPLVSCNGEGNFTESGLAPTLWTALQQHNELIAEKNRTIFNELPGYPVLDDDDIKYIFASCISLFLLHQSKGKPSARAVGERSPSNARIFDVFAALFPTAKFIQIVRDGRDCAVSGWFHNVRVTPEWASKNFQSMNDYAVKFVDIWIRDLAAAQAFAERHPDRFRRVRYEDLSRDTERALGDLFAFLGVDASAGDLAACRSAASFEKLTGGRAAGDENRESFIRKAVSGDWHNHLSREVASVFRQRAGRWLDRLGYA